MPTPWTKSGVSRLISGLRSKRRSGSPLVVETGFPTSLADLVVKHHRARLKKKSPLDHQSPPPLRRATTSPPPAIAAEFRRATTTPPTAIAAEPRRPTTTPPTAIAKEIRPPLLAAAAVEARNPWCGLLVAKLFALALLAIGGKQLVARITIAAFALFALDLLGFRVLQILRPYPDARWSINSVTEAPAREIITIETLERTREGSVGEISLERRDLDVIDKGSGDCDTGSSTSADSRTKKKHWRRRFMPKKRRSKRDAEDARVLESCSVGRRMPDCFDGEEEDEGEHSDGEAITVENCNEVSQFNGEAAQLIQENASAARMLSSRQMLLFVVLLFALVGGRVAALMATVAWFILTRSIDTLRGKWWVH